MLPDVCLSRIRALIVADVSDGVAGTGTTLPTTSDTALETAVAAAEQDVTIASSSNGFQVTHDIPSTDANGNTITEWGIRMNSEATLMQRIVLNGIAKTSGKELTKITNFSIIRGT